MDNATDGKDHEKLPGALPVAEIRAKYAMLKHDFSKNHWTDIETFKRLMTDIHKWMVDKIEKAGLDKNEQRYIIILDVYSVHRSAEFLQWWRGSGMGKQGLLIFVPANYTGQLQPLDVSFNGPFKAILRRAMQSWLSEVIASKFARS